MDLGKIEVDLAALVGGQADEYSLRQAIIDAAVDRLVTTEVRNAFRERISPGVDLMIREHVAPLLITAVNDAVQPTDRWGTPKGTPTTLREHIIRVAKEQLKTENREGYSRSNKTDIENYIDRQIAATIKSDLSGAIGDATAQIVARIREEASNLFAEALRRGVRL